ncbi:MAG: TonB-dependent receptor [Parvibaculum sp.]|nr:TonB-dependent receptor [Parvibaculum sp.]
MKKYSAQRHFLALSFALTLPFAAINAKAAEPVAADKSADDAVTLAPLVITGEKSSPMKGLDAPDYKSGTLTSQGVGEAQDDFSHMPGAVAIIPAEKFSDKFASNLEDTFSFTPGVFARKRYGQEVRLTIRGAGLSRGFHLRSIELLQDGIPLTQADGSGDFQDVDPLILQHIEVYRGGDGLRYGAASLGGAINLATPTAHTAKAENLIRIDGGSFGTIRGHTEVARIIDNVDFFASTTAIHSDGARQHSREDTARFNGNLGIRLNETAETRFYFNYNSVDQDLPGTVSLSNAINNPEAAAPGSLAGDQQRNVRSIRLANKTSFAIGSDGVLDVGGYVGYNSLFHPIFQTLDYDASSTGLFARYTDEGTLFGKRNVVTAGVRAGYTALTGNNYVNAAGNRGALIQESSQDSTSSVIYAENAFYALSDLAIVTGLQGVNATRKYESTVALTGVHKEDDADFTSLSPKLGLLWDIADGAQAYTNITRSYEPPIMSDLTQTLGAGTSFTPMDPQRAVTFEMGTRGTTKHVAWDLALYRAKVEDELVNFTTGPGIPASTFNARNTLHQGIEAALSLDIGALTRITHEDKLILEQVYTYAVARFEGDAVYGDNDLAGSTPHVYTAAIRYRSSQGWDIAPKVDWVPDGGYVDYSNTQKSPSYAMYGIEGGIDVTPTLRLFVEGRNLTDEHAVTSYTTVTTYVPNSLIFYPADGRAIYAGFTASF